MLTERQTKLLEALVREYIRTAEPVASGRLQKRAGIEASSATIRNDLAELAEAGYLTQLHASAGRAPTERAYRFYIEECIRPDSRRVKIRIRIPKSDIPEYERRLALAARLLAELTGESVILGYGGRANYYGMSNLFLKPEFRETVSVLALAETLDHLDEVVCGIMEEFENDFKIMLGRENPFAPECGAVLAYLRPGRRKRAVLGVFGPMRMDYELNLAVLERIRRLIVDI